MKFENTAVYNIDNALRGMRNAFSSWKRSDSAWRDGEYVIGEADLTLAKKLIVGGSEHRKFLRQIFVSVDITAPLYWWSEFDTYKVGTAANSTSTMHTLSKSPITPEMFEHDTPPIDSDTFAACDTSFAGDTSVAGDAEFWAQEAGRLEEIRLKFNETKDYRYFRALKQRLPRRSCKSAP